MIFANDAGLTFQNETIYEHTSILYIIYNIYITLNLTIRQIWIPGFWPAFSHAFSVAAEAFFTYSEKKKCQKQKQGFGTSGERSSFPGSTKAIEIGRCT